MEVDVRAIADGIDADLVAAGTPERAAKEAAYLKSELLHYGTSVPAVRSAATSALRRGPALDHDQIVELAELLWRDPVHERRMAAVEVLSASTDLLSSEDADLLERLLRESRTWALVDGLSASVAGSIAERDDAFGPVLDRWASDDDPWIRRAALLTPLVPLRRGGGDFERFGRYADAMLDETEPFIRKAIGWVLRDTAKRRPDMVFEWLLPRAGQASGVTVREAVKPLSDEQRRAVLAAR
ncbi:DNA alkylation repair protein [Dermatobacter hominis]|uniref:DNA alkylation repair protein n=1 Tax=Dermatobacter hominis TaxID=2884263 RepID=UPI001D12D571|nr:DNA alkylation repair protein [Dermatobacter hominis]UDY35876.1 DNA alkylation repair protein [Dermatobacter hominis]